MERRKSGPSLEFAMAVAEATGEVGAVVLERVVRSSGAS